MANGHRMEIDLPSLEGRDPARVLVADDDPDVRDTVSATLSGGGYVVTAVGDGRSALSIIERELFDLVILDVAMPGMSGVEVCRQVRNTTRTLSLPIIMLTSRVHVMHETEGLIAGADLYLAKPFSPRSLLANVEKLLTYTT